MSSKNEKKSNVLQFDEKYSRTYYYILTTSPLNFLRIGKEA